MSWRMTSLQEASCYFVLPRKTSSLLAFALGSSAYTLNPLVKPRLEQFQRARWRLKLTSMQQVAALVIWEASYPAQQLPRQL